MYTSAFAASSSPFYLAESTDLFQLSLLVEINGKTIKWKLNIYNYLSLLWRIIITPRAHWKISATRAIFPPSSNVYIFSFRVYWKGLFFDVNFSDAIRDCRGAIWMRGCELDSRRRKSHKNVSINFGLLSFIIIVIVSKAANAQTQIFRSKRGRFESEILRKEVKMVGGNILFKHPSLKFMLKIIIGPCRSHIFNRKI